MYYSLTVPPIGITKHLFTLFADPTLNVSKLNQVLASVKNWYDLGGYRYGLGIPPAVRDEIQERNIPEDDKKGALLDYYLKYAPFASWTNVAGALHYREEKVALKAVKDFITDSPG